MARLARQKNLLIAVDTNVLLDLAEDNEAAWGAVEIIRRRLKDAQIVAVPTVIQELAHLVDHGETKQARNLALIAARKFVREWKFVPINLAPVRLGITEQIAARIREKKLLPAAEVNDSFIVAESALAPCAILLSSDGHVLDIPSDRLNLLLTESDVSTLVISSPRDIAKKF
jgi:predicted nucleic acid-binding protein